MTDPLDAPGWDWDEQPLAPRRAWDDELAASARPAVQVPKPCGDPVKEVCRLIREARCFWDAHQNAACRQRRQRALELYERLTPEQRERVPQVLRVWLRYRSERYFGAHRTSPRRHRS